MKIEVLPSTLSGIIPAIASKSDAHRIFISAALADEETTIKITTMSMDMEATINVITALGGEVQRLDDKRMKVTPLKKQEEAIVANCVESGSTLRFLLPVAAALGFTCTFTGEGRLPQRPLEALLSEMKAHGIATDSDTLPMTISGQLEGGIYRLPGDVSSQYISGLLFALPLLKDSSMIELSTETQSTPYIDMTIDTLKKFGIVILKKEHSYVIPGGQQYRSPFHCEVEGDWSNAAFWLCGGAMKESVTVKGLNFLSRQGDKNLIHLLVQMGATIVPTETSYGVISAPLHGITIDAKEIPDLVPILAVTATAAKGKTRIINSQRLRLKECDRLQAITKNLSLLGADITETEDGLIIQGGTPLKGGIVNSFNDHRIAMAMTIAALNSENSIMIEDAAAIAKSYPNFYADFVKLGGKVNVF